MDGLALLDSGNKKSPDVETPGLWYLDLISVVSYGLLCPGL